MNKSKSIELLALLLVAILYSCTPPIVFDKAYPSGQENLVVIPESYRGAFICESDSAVVVITSKDITLHKTHYFNTKIKYAEQRADCQIVDDKMYLKGREECISIMNVNDSIVQGIYNDIDTLFVIQDQSHARIYKGHLVLNQEMNTSEWTISLLTPEQGGDLILRAITRKTKIENVERITQTFDITRANDKSPRYKVKPTIIEFDAMLADNKIFIECEYLVRVQLEGLLLN